MTDGTESADGRIVVAVAGRSDAAAIGYAVDRAIATGAELLLGEDSYHELEGAVLWAVAHDVVSSRPRPPAVSTELATGPVVETIVAHSRRADLLVVQHRPGRHGVGLGSTVRGVLTRASVPVAVVPAAEAGVEEPGARSVTLGIDDPDEAPTLLRAALREARTRGARLTVLHARSAHPPDGITPEGSEDDRCTQRLRDAVAAQVTAAGPLVPTEPVRIAVVHEDVAPALVEESRFAGLLVVGHRRRPRHGRDRIGPVVRDVVRHSRCPVLVVPYDGPRPEPQSAR